MRIRRRRDKERKNTKILIVVNTEIIILNNFHTKSKSLNESFS